MNHRRRTKTTVVVPPRAPVIGALLFVAVCAGHLPAQVAERPPLYEQEPYDVLVLTAAHDSARLDIFPTRFPQRKYERGAGDALRIRLLAYADREFDVRWNDIETVVVYEDLLLEAARQATADGQFASAYRHLERLAEAAPDWPGIDAALLALMRADAADSYRRGKPIQALGTLDFLFAANPAASSTTAALFAVADRLFQRQLARQRYVQAREMIRHFQNRYGPGRTRKYVTAWEEKLHELSDKYLEKARQLAAEPRAALGQIELARKLWPESPQVAKLSAQLVRQYPRVLVGVTRAAAVESYWNEWSARRVGRLRARRLVEITGIDSDGARYQGLLGRLEVRDGGAAAAYLLDAQQLGGSDVSVKLPDLAGRVFQSIDPAQNDYFPLWHRVVDGIDVVPTNELVMQFRKPLLRPAAFLHWPLSDPRAASDSGRNQTWQPLVPYTAEAPGRYQLNPEYALRQPHQPVEISERIYTDGGELAAALRAGDVHVADRLTGVEVETLTDVPGIMTRSYLFPSIHFLLPNTDNGAVPRLVHDRNYRRAVTFAIDRAAILRHDLLAGRTVLGCQPISGPLPPGLGKDDPLAYAYDDEILPRGYDPSVGVTLARLAEANFARRSGLSEQDEPPAVPPLVLAHPQDPLCRAACQAIASYLNAARIECRLTELPPGRVLPDADVDWDLLYVDTVLSEPVTDVQRLFGLRGLVGQTSPYLQSALGRLAKASVWSDARAILREVHRVTHDELTVIPLWQWVDYYAYRDYLSGVTRNAVSLYQDVERWRVHPENAR